MDIFKDLGTIEAGVLRERKNKEIKIFEDPYYVSVVMIKEINEQLKNLITNHHNLSNIIYFFPNTQNFKEKYSIKNIQEIHILEVIKHYEFFGYTISRKYDMLIISF